MSTTDSVPQSPPRESYTSPHITIVLTVVLLLFFFIGFFSIYLCRCVIHNLLYTLHIHRIPSGSPVGREGPCRTLPGIDPFIIQAFPTFTYSSVKDYKREKYGLECAICLCEFEDDNMLRLITTCNHVFHQECIDLWLEFHKTCPVCRRTLDEPEKSPEKLSPAPSLTNNSMHEVHENELLEDVVSITIKDDDKAEREKDAGRSMQTEEGHDHKEDVGWFSRSKSTGHSIVRARRGGGEGEDRFTLILPEHVKAKIIKGHHLAKSCTTFGEFKSRTSVGNGGFGEISCQLPGGKVSKL